MLTHQHLNDLRLEMTRYKVTGVVKRCLGDKRCSINNKYGMREFPTYLQYCTVDPTSLWRLPLHRCQDRSASSWIRSPASQKLTHGPTLSAKSYNCARGRGVRHKIENLLINLDSPTLGVMMVHTVSSVC